MMRLNASLLFFCIFLLSAGCLSLASSSYVTLGAAWADDDDDGDDGGDDDDDSDYDGDDRGRVRSGNQGGNTRIRLRTNNLPRWLQPQRRTPTRRAPSSPPASPPPEFASGEIVTLGLSDEDLAALVAQGFGVLEEISLPGLVAQPRRLSTPSELSLTQARDLVRGFSSGQDADFNHYYRSEQGFSPDCKGSDCPARQMIDWSIPMERAGSCGSSVAIGMVDTGINEKHPTFEGADIEVTRLISESLDVSRALHGTAVAALLIGAPGTRSPGLVPAAKLVAVDAFYRQGGDERADVFTLSRALGHLAEADVSVINLSLAGPENTVLAEAINRLVKEQDIVVVAAVGNSGPKAKAEYPAAYEPVIAVTAVDRNQAIYRRAIQGEHVDLAAPGVNIWTAASVSGARWKTGTSFAVPFVTAAAAMLREAQPDLPAADVVHALRQRANDLGDAGPDPVFGAGLLNISGLCGRSFQEAPL